jgi:hypothetical protein
MYVLMGMKTFDRNIYFEFLKERSSSVMKTFLETREDDFPINLLVFTNERFSVRFYPRTILRCRQ